MRTAFLLATLLISYLATVPLDAHGQQTMVGSGYCLFTTSFSNDGKHVLVGGGGGCWVYSAENGNLLERQNRLTRTAAFSHDDSSMYATWGDDNIIQMNRIGEKNEVWKVTRTDGYNRQLVFFPDGKKIAACSYYITKGREFSGSIQILEVASGKELHRIDFKDEYPNSIAVSRDGNHLAAGMHVTREKSKIVVYKCDEWKIVHDIPMTDGFPSTVSFLNDDLDLLVVGGKYFGEGMQPKHDSRMWRADLTGKGYQMKRIHHEEGSSYRRAIVSADGSVVIAHHSVGRSQFKRDGKKLRETSWRLVPIFQKRDTTSGELIWTHESSQAGRAECLQFSASGKQFLYVLNSTAYVVSTETGEIMQELTPEVK